jgi:hypothetical protein
MAILSTPSRLSEPHGQALIAAFRAEAIPDRQIDELMGLCNDVLAETNVV